MSSSRPIKCDSCGKIVKWCTRMAENTFFCPRCYSAYRIHQAGEMGIRLEPDELLAIFEGRKHVDDVLSTRGMKSEPRN